MKIKYIIFSLFLLIIVNLFGQQFVSQSNEWFTDDCCYAQGQTDCSTFKYWFDEAVMFDSVTYFKLSSNNSNPLFEVGEFYREEEGIVFMKLDENDEEILIYNFNLNTGEQLEIGDLSHNIQIEVLAVDSITLISGEKRKRLEIASASNTNYKTYWIEGIGSELSPMNPLNMFSFDCWIELNCFYNDESVKFQLGDCQLTNLSEFYNVDEKIICYPNPAGAEIVISTGDKRRIDKVEINGIDGVSIVQVNSQETQSINLNGMSDGFYFVKIAFKDGSIGVAKFVKYNN